MTLLTPTRYRTDETTRERTAVPAAPAGTKAPEQAPGKAGKASSKERSRADRRRRDADGMAVASFVLGLMGLLVFNIVLGPCALVLGGLALARGTGRPARALLGLGLGAADLVVLAVLVAADNTVSWSI